MLIKKETEYAVLGLRGLMNQKTEYADVKKISLELGLSPALMAKIFQKLSKAGILESKFGPSGGFKLHKKPNEIAFLEIMEIIQGKSPVIKCFNGTSTYCQHGGCQMRNLFDEVEDKVNQILETTTLEKINQK